MPNHNQKKSLNDLSSDEIVKACEQNYINYWRLVGKTPNAEFSDDRGITQCLTGISQDVFNVVLKCNLSTKNIEKRIDEAIDLFRSRGNPLLWHTGLTTEPRDIGKYLEARGFPHDYDLAAMAVNLDDFEKKEMPEGISVKTVENELECRQWTACLAASWGSPPNAAPWMMENACFNLNLEKERGLTLPRKMYLGSLIGRPAGVSMLVWSEDIAGLEMVGTAPDVQYKGVGTAVVNTIMQDARALGFRFIVVLGTIEGIRLYEKCGFEKFGKLPEHSLIFENKKT